ncbi:amino acid ABC transporter substrate-binding protein [Sinanaerobacter sp. ZZT-01]|uniref:amino acid ABC transporter substrate-binding protein n=1 Tax=Sinanaerobacter sp. ZZT-01 TaxID=3111540 RepID=UPI002D765112|nr:amino acid ABC transporter substrate-binding protein [Sinanaerobacter sp. ZZT-01]WRR92842.1 amino acid ABC transporter substrate-binding protein [Sinanaerobacter sp. ZZT-01]
MKRWSWILVLVLLIGVFATGCGKKGNSNEVTVDDTSLTDVQAKGTLVIGCDDEFPPMGFRNESGEVTGFDIELAKLVAEKLDVEAVVQPIDWKTKEMSLESNKIDVIWNGYTIDKERNGKVEYTKPYLNNQQVIVVKADSKINTKADLADKIVGVQANSSGLKAIKKDKEFESTLAELKEYDTYPQALLDLTGRTDAVVIDKILIGYVMTQEPDTYRILDETMGDEYYGIGCRKSGVALRVAIDDALDELMNDGSIEALSTKWFGSNIVIRDVEKLTDEDLVE